MKNKTSKIVYDYSKLRGRIKEIFGKQETFAPLIGINRASLSSKLNNKSSFSQNEISKSIELLNIPYEEINLNFFTQKVKKT